MNSRSEVLRRNKTARTRVLEASLFLQLSLAEQNTPRFLHTVISLTKQILPGHRHISLTFPQQTLRLHALLCVTGILQKGFGTKVVLNLCTFHDGFKFISISNSLTQSHSQQNAVNSGDPCDVVPHTQPTQHTTN